MYTVRYGSRLQSSRVQQIDAYNTHNDTYSVHKGALVVSCRARSPCLLTSWGRLTSSIVWCQLPIFFPVWWAGSPSSPHTQDGLISLRVHTPLCPLVRYMYYVWILCVCVCVCILCVLLQVYLSIRYLLCVLQQGYCSIRYLLCILQQVYCVPSSCVLRVLQQVYLSIRYLRTMWTAAGILQYPASTMCSAAGILHTYIVAVFYVYWSRYTAVSGIYMYCVCTVASLLLSFVSTTGVYYCTAGRQ